MWDRKHEQCPLPFPLRRLSFLFCEMGTVISSCRQGVRVCAPVWAWHRANSSRGCPAHGVAQDMEATPQPMTGLELRRCFLPGGKGRVIRAFMLMRAHSWEPSRREANQRARHGHCWLPRRSMWRRARWPSRLGPCCAAKGSILAPGGLRTPGRACVEFLSEPHAPGAPQMVLLFLRKSVTWIHLESFWG